MVTLARFQDLMPLLTHSESTIKRISMSSIHSTPLLIKDGSVTPLARSPLTRQGSERDYSEKRLQDLLSSIHNRCL